MPHSRYHTLYYSATATEPEFQYPTEQKYQGRLFLALWKEKPVGSDVRLDEAIDRLEKMRGFLTPEDDKEIWAKAYCVVCSVTNLVKIHRWQENPNATVGNRSRMQGWGDCPICGRGVHTYLATSSN